MKMISRVLMTAVAVAALAAPAMAADKLMVQDATGASTVYKVDDTGTITTTSSVFNFDSTNKRIGINTTTPGYPMDLNYQWPSSVSTQQMVGATSYNDVARFAVRRVDLTGGTGAPKAITAGQQLGNFNFRGHDGTNFSVNGVAAIIANAGEVFTPTSQAARLGFVSTPSGAIAGVERARVPESGGFRIMSLATMPTCDGTGAVTSAASGTLWFVAGGAGVKDALSVCAKDAAGTYAWRTIY